MSPYVIASDSEAIQTKLETRTVGRGPTRGPRLDRFAVARDDGTIAYRTRNLIKRVRP